MYGAEFESLHPIQDALIRHAAVDGGQLEDRVFFAVDRFGAQDLGVVVAREIGACKVAVRHLARQPLRQGQPDRLRHVGKENPQIVTPHEQDLAALGGRRCHHDDGVLVTLRQHAVRALVRTAVLAGRDDRNVDLEAFGREADAIRVLDDFPRLRVIARCCDVFGMARDRGERAEHQDDEKWKCA